MRSCAALKISNLLFITYQRDGQLQPGVSLYIDDFVLSAAPIGCGTRVEYATGVRTQKADRSAPSASFSVSAKACGRGFLVRSIAEGAADGVNVVVYSQTGRKLQTLRLVRAAGRTNLYVAEWDGNAFNGARLRPGIYVARIEAGAKAETSPIVLVY
jgi:hypothetical protein